MNAQARRLAFAASLAIALLAWTLAFAWPGAGAPWNAETRQVLPLPSFASQTAQLGIGERGLRAHATEPGRLVDLHLDLAGTSAESFRHFSYSIDGVPATRKLVLVWQGSEGRGFAILPDGFGHGGTIDLGRVASWKGSIDRIGLALVPVDYVPPQALSAPEISIDELSLSSSSICGALSALWSEWTAARAWTGRSTNTGGFDFVGSPGPSLPAFVAGCLAIALVLARLWLGRAIATRLALPLLVAGTTLLAMEQIRQHVARTSTVVAAQRALPHDAGIGLSGHPPLAADARALLQRLQQEGRRVRIRVHGAAGFMSDYAVWLLREQDVGAVLSPHELAPQAELADSFLVLVGKGDWDFDAAASRIRVGAESRGAAPYFEGSTIKVYRFAAPTGAAP